jgi:DNA-binding Lrp family transcriptional regulator
MARKKSKGTELSVFKGREAKLNRAILIILVKNSPQIIYDIAKAIRQQKGLTNTKYTNVNRRVKALEKQGFLEKAGCRYTQPGAQGALFQATTRAYVALLLNQINSDRFVKEADENTLMAELATLTLFFEKTAEKKII